MNFDFLKECKLESPELQGMYDTISAELEKAEWKYWRNPQECGVILRGVAEKICRVYNLYYEIGCPKMYSLEEFLCYTDDEAHNALVSRFLSTVRKEQRDRLNKLRMLGDDCIWGENAPVRGMSFDDRMAQNAKKMMETVMEVLKEMCEKINKRDDVYDEFFLEIGLPEKREDVLAERENQRKTTEKKSWFGRLLSRKDHV
ncbi:MAG: hypothetical protein PUJ55_13825 [Clostridiales bacterium]|nr:hypothetical protein [Roseburia sp.]MDD7638000.1 hypothetical protein [Clostridiales bacterium]MDY4112915.1 hypothetical protein [Roseburia sp.]